MGQGTKLKKRTRDDAAHELVMPNISDSLHDIRAFTAAAISELPLGRDAEWDVVLAVGEAATNCVVHGQSKDGSRNLITTRVRALADCVRIELEDDGPGFHADTSTWPVPNLTSEKGRGIFIMRTLMDGVEYPKVGKGTRCVLTKRFPRAHAARRSRSN